MAPSLRRGRGFKAGVVAGAVLPAAVLVALSLWAGSPPSTAPAAAGIEADRLAFTRYEQAVDRAVQDGGFVVTQGMKPGLADISEGAFDDATLAQMARGWMGSMERVRSELGAVVPPSFLSETARLYDQALAAYLEVAAVLVMAAEATGDERAALIERVPPLGERADALWDRAHEELEDHRLRLGLADSRGTP